MTPPEPVLRQAGILHESTEASLQNSYFVLISAFDPLRTLAVQFKSRVLLAHLQLATRAATLAGIEAKASQCCGRRESGLVPCSSVQPISRLLFDGVAAVLAAQSCKILPESRICIEFGSE
jgi:hypothetical protein